MRATLLAVSLLVGGVLLGYVPIPEAEAARPEPPRDDVYCGFVPIGFSRANGFSDDFETYCIVQSFEVTNGAECPTMLDISLRELPESNPASTAPQPCGANFLRVSGESSGEWDDTREWTELAFVRFPNWYAKMTDHLGARNITPRLGFVTLWYDDRFYADNPAIEPTTKQRTLFATDLRTAVTPGLTWRNLENAAFDVYLNNSLFSDGFGQLPGLPGSNVCPRQSGANCRLFVLDSSGFGGRDLLARVARGWRTDNGYAIMDSDFFRPTSGQSPRGPSDDRGTCTDPSHPPGPETSSTQRPPTPIPAATSTCLQVFRSANWPGNGDPGRRPECSDIWISGFLDNDNRPIPGTGVPGLEGEPEWVCWPRLVVHYSRNAPYVDGGSLVYNRSRSALDGTPVKPYSGLAPLNVTLDVGDEWGAILDVRMRIETSVVNSAGRSESRVLPGYEDLKLTSRAWNGSRDPVKVRECACERWQYWRHLPLDLPPGNYWVNFTLEDTDHNKVKWPPTLQNRRPNLVIDETVPTVSSFAFASPTIDHKAVLSFSANVASPRADQPIEAVRGEVRAPTSDGKPGALVKNLAARPVEGSVDSFRQGRWSFTGTWGRADPQRETPGTFHLWIRANDTFGRETRVFGGEFRVRDTIDPIISSVAIAAPVSPGLDVYHQEAGGPLRFAVEALDPENPRPVDVKVILAKDGAPPVESALSRGADGVYRGAITAPAQGTWTGRIVARDGDDRTTQRTFTLVSLEPKKPRFENVKPAGFANLTPDVSIQVFDHTLNLSRIRLFVGDASGLAEKSPVIEGAAPLVTVRPPPFGTLRHNAFREVKVVVTDDLGLEAEHAWNFTIDAIPPARTELTIGTPKDERVGRVLLTPATPLGFAASDAESGVAKVAARVVDLARNATGPWIEQTGASLTFTIGASEAYRRPGPYRLEWRATDRAGNVEATRSLDATVDVDAPTLRVQFDGLALRVSAEDAGGIDSLKVWYRNATESAWSERAVEIVDPQRVEAKLAIPAVPRGQRFYYHATTVDRLGNTLDLGSRASPLEAISPNHAPALRATLPANGTVVKGVLPLPYEAPDKDRDAVRVVLSVRPLVLAEPRVLATVSGASGALAWDTAGWPDGTYDVMLLASDGSLESTVTARVEVRNTATGVFAPAAPSGRVEYTDPVTFSATVYKPLREAKVRLLDAEGREVGTVLLRDDGRNGDAVAGDHVFSADYVPPRTGSFKAELLLAYENEPATKEDLGTFSVESSVLRALARNALPIGLGALVALGVAAAVVVQLVRYGYLFAKD